ncbi:MAG: hypothetical protein ACI9UV_002174, partial [Algoriphagus sp.]
MPYQIQSFELKIILHEKPDIHCVIERGLAKKESLWWRL